MENAPSSSSPMRCTNSLQWSISYAHSSLTNVQIGLCSLFPSISDASERQIHSLHIRRWPHHKSSLLINWFAWRGSHQPDAARFRLLRVAQHLLQQLRRQPLPPPLRQRVHIQNIAFQPRQIPYRRWLLEKDQPTASHNLSLCLCHP